jgi:tRNA(Ile)-lysidine synthase
MLLSAKVQTFIEKKKLVKKGETIIIGVSGGCDSVVLAHVLFSLKHSLGVHLHVAHYNHNLRKDSKRDEEFVKKLAEKMCVPFSSESWQHSKQEKGSVEELAREKRIAFFKKVAKDQNTHTIALAHTKDDLAETVLMRMIRGASLQGLRAILPKKEMQGLTIIRPLLDCTKKDVLHYTKQQKLAFREDYTNQQTIFFRNKIRLNLIPDLEQNYNPNIRDTLARLAVNLAKDYDYIEEKIRITFTKQAQINLKQKTISFALSGFNKCHPAERHMMIRMAIQTLKGDTNRLTSKHMDEMEQLINSKPAQSIVHLPHQMSIQKTKQDLILRRD